LELHGLAAVGTRGRIELKAAIAPIDEQGERWPHEATALPPRFSFEFAKAGIWMLVIPILQAVKQPSSRIQECGTALGTRERAGHR